MRTLRLSVGLLAAALIAGCKTSPDEALVVFDVTVAADVTSYAHVNFSVVTPSGVADRAAPGTPPARMFRFGYYMAASGNVTIRGRALDASGCVVGEGTLMVSGVEIGQTTEAPQALTIAHVSASCSTDGGTDSSGKGGSGGAAGNGAAGTGGAGGSLGGSSGTGGSTAGAGGNAGSTAGTGGTGGGAGTGGGTAGTGATAGTGGGAGTGATAGTGGAAGRGGSGGGTAGTGATAGTGGAAGRGGSSGGTGGSTGGSTAGTGGTPKKANGDACGAGTECISTICADGVCCNAACTGSCEYCNNPGTPGQCGYVTGAPRTGHTACAGTAPCNGSCGGASATCVFPGSGTVCRQPSCASGTETSMAGCNGSGACPTAVTRQCNPFICGATACVTSCTANSQCVAGAACMAGNCVMCAAAETVCGNACVNTSTSAANCGACGHSCRGGTCAGGKCQAVQVVDTNPSDFAVASGRIYVLVSDSTTKVSTITYVPTDAAAGTAPTAFSSITNEQCLSIQVDEPTGYLFVSCTDYTSGNQYIRRIPSTGGVGTRINQVMLNGLGTVTAYPVNGNLYWWEFPGGTIGNGVRRSAFDGSGLGMLQTYNSADTVHSMLGADSTHVFIWQAVAGVESLRQVAIADGSTITLYNNGFAQAGFASDGTTAFWYTGGGGVYSVPKGTTTATMNTVFADSTLSVMGPVDATSVYYGTDVDAVSGATGCTSYRVARRPKAGGSETALVDGVDNCVGTMKGDANIVVWWTRGRGCGTMTCTRPLMKVAK